MKSKILPLLVPSVLYLAHVASFGTWIVDDAGISFAYARNLAEGYGLVAQPGLTPVEGYSNPLWMFLMSSLFALGVFDPVWWPKAISCVCVIVGFYLLLSAWARIGGRPLAISAALAATALQPSFAIWTTSGLENGLYFLLYSALFVSALRLVDPQSESAPELRASVISGVLAVGLVLTRPEGVLLVGVIPIVVLWTRGKNGVSRLVPYVVTVIVGLILVVGFRWLYFGDFVPNTFHAKGAGTYGKLLRALGGTFLLSALIMFWRRRQKSTPASTAVFLAVAALVIWWPRFDRLLRSIGGPLGLVLAVLLMWRIAMSRLSSWRICLLVHLGFGLLVNEVLPRDWMGENRFATLFFPFFFMSVADYLSELSSRLRPRWIAILTVVVTFAYLVPATIRTLRFRDAPIVPLALIEERFHRPFLAMQELVGDALDSVLITDIGAMLLYSPLRVDDLAGLCDRSIAKYVMKDREGLYDEIFSRRKPDLISVHGVFAEWCRFGSDKRLRRDYDQLLTYETREDIEGFVSGLFLRREHVGTAARRAEILRIVGK